jgi:hypothetical protein
LLFGKLVAGGKVTVDVDDKNAVVLTFDEVSTLKPTKLKGEALGLTNEVKELG